MSSNPDIPQPDPDDKAWDELLWPVVLTAIVATGIATFATWEHWTAHLLVSFLVIGAGLALSATWGFSGKFTSRRWCIACGLSSAFATALFMALIALLIRVVMANLPGVIALVLLGLFIYGCYCGLMLLLAIMSKL